MKLKIYFLLIFLLLLLLYSVGFAITINLCFSYDNSLSSEELYEGYQLAMNKINFLDKFVNFNFINLTPTSTNATNLLFLLNNNPTILSRELPENILNRISISPIIASFPTSKYFNPYPLPKNEVNTLKYKISDTNKILFIYNSNPYAYNYLKALESIPDKTIFVKKYSTGNISISQMIEKNSITTIVAFLDPIQLKNLVGLVNKTGNILNRFRIFAFSIYDYFDFINEYTTDYNNLYFLSIFNLNSQSEFSKEYFKKYGHIPTATVAVAYDSVLLLYSILQGKDQIDASSKIIIKDKSIERPLYLYKVINGQPTLQAILKY